MECILFRLSRSGIVFLITYRIYMYRTVTGLWFSNIHRINLQGINNHSSKITYLIDQFAQIILALFKWKKNRILFLNDSCCMAIELFSKPLYIIFNHHLILIGRQTFFVEWWNDHFIQMQLNYIYIYQKWLKRRMFFVCGK